MKQKYRTEHDQQACATTHSSSRLTRSENTSSVSSSGWKFSSLVKRHEGGGQETHTHAENKVKDSNAQLTTTAATTVKRHLISAAHVLEKPFVVNTIDAVALSISRV